MMQYYAGRGHIPINRIPPIRSNQIAGPGLPKTNQLLPLDSFDPGLTGLFDSISKSWDKYVADPIQKGWDKYIGDPAQKNWETFVAAPTRANVEALSRLKWEDVEPWVQTGLNVASVIPGPHQPFAAAGAVVTNSASAIKNQNAQDRIRAMQEQAAAQMYADIGVPYSPSGNYSQGQAYGGNYAQPGQVQYAPQKKSSWFMPALIAGGAVLLLKGK